jgi:hypothetical protein
VRRADARSAQIDNPNGVTRCFQVSVNKIEPTEAVLARNLLSKDDCRLALRDERVPVRPEMPLVVKPSAAASLGERLAGARARPNSAIVSPPSETQGIRPDSDAGEEMALRETGEVTGPDVKDASFIYFPGGDQPRFDQFSQPRGGARVVLVVVGSHVN